MDDKELAEKVAVKLGWKLEDAYFGDYTKRGWCPPGTMEGHCTAEYVSCLLEEWDIFGLMVEKAEEIWWHFQCFDRRIYFVLSTFKKPTKGETQTRMYSVQDYGYIKASALAFLNIPLKLDGNKPLTNSGSQENDGLEDTENKDA